MEQELNSEDKKCFYFHGCGEKSLNNNEICEGIMGEQKECSSYLYYKKQERLREDFEMNIQASMRKGARNRYE